MRTHHRVREYYFIKADKLSFWKSLNVSNWRGESRINVIILLTVPTKSRTHEILVKVSWMDKFNLCTTQCTNNANSFTSWIIVCNPVFSPQTFAAPSNHCPLVSLKFKLNHGSTSVTIKNNISDIVFFVS